MQSFISQRQIHCDRMVLIYMGSKPAPREHTVAGRSAERGSCWKRDEQSSAKAMCTDVC